MLELMNDLEQWDPVMVEWMDSTTVGTGWTPAADLILTPKPCMSVGMMFAQNDYGICLVLGRDLEYNDVHGATLIPWTSIVSVRKLA